MLFKKHLITDKPKKHKEPVRIGNFLVIVIGVAAIVTSLVMMNPSHPVPQISQEAYKTFLRHINSLLTASRNATIVTSPELNSFFHAQVIKTLRHEREYIGHPDPITFRNAYLHDGHVVLVVHYRNKKHPRLAKDVYISGKLVVGRGKLGFKPQVMSCGLLYLPAIFAKKLLHPLERRFLANMRIPDDIENIIIKGDEASITRRLD